MKEAFRLDGKTALVTGASRGIGLAIALELGKAGARIGVHCLNRISDAQAAVQTIGKAEAFQADLRRLDDLRRLAFDCREALGPIDVLVHNAGIWNEMSIEAADPERLDEMLDLNLKPLFHLAAEVVPGMKRKNWGRIISIGSTAGLIGEPLHSHYAASKGGLESLIRSLAVELGPHGITANSVAPGWTLTEMTRDTLDQSRFMEITSQIPTRRIAAPEDLAYAVRFLASEEARHVNGVCLPVEGGYRWRR